MVVSSTSTPQKKTSSAAACSKGILVPSRATPSASVALNSPGSNSSSSSRGKKTGSTLGAHGVAAVYFKRRSLAGWSNRSPRAAAWLQPTTTRRTRRSLGNRLRRHIGHCAGQNDLLQRSRLQALHRLEHRVLDLRQVGARMSLAPRNKLPCHRLARRLPARQHPL